jgi:hypothetical protein
MRAMAQHKILENQALFQYNKWGSVYGNIENRLIQEDYDFS